MSFHLIFVKFGKARIKALSYKSFITWPYTYGKQNVKILDLSCWSLIRIAFRSRCNLRHCPDWRSLYYRIYHLHFRFVYPWAKTMSVTHDSFHCVKYGGQRQRKTGLMLPFPTKRLEGTESNFVAAVTSNRPVLNVSCPLECRPKGHKDWSLC